MKKVFNIIGLCLICMGIQAQSLDSLIRECLAENRMLAAGQIFAEAAGQMPEQVNVLPDPEIGINAFVSPVETRLGPQQLRLGATQMLPWKGTIEARTKLALFPSLLAKNEVEKSKIDLVWQLKLSYLELYRVRKSWDIIRKQQGWLEQLRQLALIRMESSAGDLASVARIDLKINELKWRADQLQLEEQIQILTINQLCNRPADAPVATPDTLTIFFPKGEFQKAFGEHPELRDAELRQQQSEARIGLIQKERKPSFGIGLDYIVVGRRSDMNPAGNGRDIVSPRVNIKIPIYGATFDAKLAEQKLTGEALELRRSDHGNKLEQARSQSRLQWQSAVAECEWIETQLEGLEQLIRLKTAAFEAGKTPLDSLLELFLERENYQWRSLQARVRSAQAVAAWGRAAGIIY